MTEPILGKAKPHKYDHKAITLTALLTLKNAAQRTANKIGYPVYMVGSALYKEIPRDIDIVVRIPTDDYERMFGKLPTKRYGRYMARVFLKTLKYVADLHFCLEEYHLDVKVVPNSWWTDNPKMLLANPTKGASK